MLEKSFLIAFIVFGLHYIMYTPTMILSFVADWAARKKIPQWIDKPLYSCAICMTIYYGSGIYWIFLGKSIPEWLVCIFCAMGINSVIVWMKHR